MPERTGEVDSSGSLRAVELPPPCRRCYCAFFTKCRGEMPMSSSSARIIGEAPTNWTALRWRLDPVDRIEKRAGTDEIDPVDVAHVDLRHPARVCEFGESRELRRGRPQQRACPEQRVRFCQRRVLHGSGGGGFRQGGRFPRRRRKLEGHRVLDRAILEGFVCVGPLKKLERKQPRAFAALAALLDRRVEQGFQFLGPLKLQRELLAPRVAERGRKQPRAFVVKPGHRQEIDPDFRELLRHRALQALELGRYRVGELAGQADVATRRRARARLRLLGRLPRRRRPLELDDIVHRELIERDLVARPLLQIEQREPCERRQLGVVVRLHTLFEQRACLVRMPAREAQRGVLEHGAEARVRRRDFETRLSGRGPLDEACAGDGNVRALIRLAWVGTRGNLGRRVGCGIARGGRPPGRNRHGARSGVGSGSTRLLYRRFREHRHRGRQVVVPARNRGCRRRQRSPDTLGVCAKALIMFPS